MNNLSNLKLALLDYQAKEGRFPGDLKALVPSYIPQVPVCPVAGRDTYSTTYRTGNQGKDCFVCCKAALLLKDGRTPVYDSTQGQIRYQ